MMNRNGVLCLLISGFLGWTGMAQAQCPVPNASIPATVLNLRPNCAQVDGAACYIPLDLTVNFCTAYADIAAELNNLGWCSVAPYDVLCNALTPCIADINGQIAYDMSTTPDTLTITDNGIPDAANELGVIQRVLADPLYDNGAITHQAMLSVFTHNWYMVQCDLGLANISPNSPLTPAFTKALVAVLAAQISLGDGDVTLDTSNPLGNVVTGTGGFGSAAALHYLFCQLFVNDLGMGPCGTTLLSKADYKLGLSNKLALNGNADGDCFANYDESLYFTAQESCGTVTPSVYPPNPGLFVSGGAYACPPQLGITFLDAVLDPNLGPIAKSGGGCGGISYIFIQQNPTLLEEGDDVTLKLVTIIPTIDLIEPTNVPIQWKKNQQNIPGATSVTYSITNVQLTDQGRYEAEVDDGTKSPILSLAWNLVVYPANSVPVGDTLVLLVLSGSLAFLGTLAVRKRKLGNFR